MARTTVGNTMQRVRRQLASGYRMETNALNGAIDSDDTTVSFLFDVKAGLQPGAIIYIDLEAMRVMTVDAASKQATVIRGYYDSDPVAHDTQAEVVVNPRFSPLDIYDALLDEVLSYGPQLYRMDSQEFTVAAGDDILELPLAWNDCYGVLDVRRRGADTDVLAWPRVAYRFQRSGATAVGGKPIIRFLDGTTDATVLVQVARPFVTSTFAMTTDLVSDVKLPESMLDVVAMGTKLRLLVDNENGRGARTAQDEPRRAEETPVGSMVQPFQFNNALYRSRRQEEVNKLHALYPIVVGG